MREKSPKVNKEITNPEIIARLAAMESCKKAENELLAQFPSTLKTVAAEAMTPPVAALESIPVAPVESGSEKSEVPEKQKRKQKSEAVKSVRRRNTKSDPMPSEPAAEATEDTVLHRVPESAIESENRSDVDESGLINPFAPRRRKGDPLDRAQKEMDRLADASLSDSVSPEMKQAEAVVPEKEPEPASVVSERSGETFDETVAALRARVDAARHEYVQEDYENTNKWLKVKNFFRGIKQEKSADTEYYQAQYNNALIDLRNAELEKIKQSGLEGKELHEALAGTLQYFKYDESVNVSQERTQVRAEHQGFSGKAIEMMETFGRAYNRLSFEKKIFLTAALTGVAVAAGAAGGAAVSAVAGLALLKRAAASAGLAVGTEALLENFGNRRRMSKADKETEEQLAGLDELSSEQKFLDVEKMLEADIFYSDTRLQQAKKASAYRKLGAVTVGVAVGSGWLSQIMMEKLGGNGAIDWIKERFETQSTGEAFDESALIEPSLDTAETAGGTPEAAETVSQKMELPDEVTGPNDMAKLKAAAEYMAASPEVQAQIREVSGMTDEQLRALASSAARNASEKFHDILSSSYEVKPGDSVWKILSARVEGLEGSQKTYFIDALKDKIGDIRLEAGEKLDFSDYLTQEEIEKAFAEAQGLSPDTIAGIAANDVKIAEFARMHPDIALTDETVDSILQGKMDALAPTDLGTQAAADAGTPFETSDSAEGAPATVVSPESLAQYSGRVDDWYMQIFRMENAAPGQDWVFNKEAIGSMKLQDILQDARLFQQGSLSGYTTGLDREQITNFAEFFQGVSKESVGFDRIAFFKEHPNATVMDYLNRVAPLVSQGQRIGLYTTTH